MGLDLLQIMMNRREKRLNIVQYFLRVAQAQEQVQSLQNDLISHLRFNPAILYKKVADNGRCLTMEQLRHYIQKSTGITDREVICVYMQKHGFHGSIQLKEFSASLLPYTPNVLREATDKIEKQMETKHLDRLIEGLYQKLLEAELKNIYEISLFQKGLGLDWARLKAFIQKDFNQKSRKIDAQEEVCDIVGIRRWLQFWIQIEEYKILNMMRWFGGADEEHLQSYYTSNHIQPKCTCSSLTSRHLLSSLPKQPSISSKEKQIKKVKSASYLLTDIKEYLKRFMKYIQTIIKSQRRLDLLRESLRSHKRQVQLVLHEIASKKNSYTRLGKIIGQIQKVLRIKPDMVGKLLSELEQTKIDNNFLFSLFAAPSKKGKKHKLTHQQMVTEIYEVLYTFCLSKATLKSLARDIKDGAGQIFQQLDEQTHGILNRTDMQLILNQSDIKFKEEDLNILMNHFGDGECISEQSFKQVFEIQSRS